MKVAMHQGTHNQDMVVALEDDLVYWKSFYKSDGILRMVFSVWMNYQKQSMALDLSSLNCLELQMIYMVIM